MDHFTFGLPWWRAVRSISHRRTDLTQVTGRRRLARSRAAGSPAGVPQSARSSDVSETTAQASFLTQEAFDRLDAELQHLTTEGRAEISKRIEAARDEGDLKENGGYHAAKEEQGKMEARIRQLTHLLQHAVVGETPPDDDIVEPGMLVTVDMFGDELTFLLGSREILGDDDDMDVYSEKSPMGLAINGHKAGEEVTYDAPNGKKITVRILKAKPYSA